MNINNVIVCVSVIFVIFSSSVACGQSQHEMNDQARKAFKNSDIELNKVYNVLKSKMDAKSKVKLLVSQKAWIAFRDAEAEFVADSEARGGSLFPMIYELKRAELTKDRVRQLANLAK